jgi:hypothetical protein
MMGYTPPGLSPGLLSKGPGSLIGVISKAVQAAV